MHGRARWMRSKWGQNLAERFYGDSNFASCGCIVPDRSRTHGKSDGQRNLQPLLSNGSKTLDARLCTSWVNCSVHEFHNDELMMNVLLRRQTLPNRVSDIRNFPISDTILPSRFKFEYVVLISPSRICGWSTWRGRTVVNHACNRAATNTYSFKIISIRRGFHWRRLWLCIYGSVAASDAHGSTARMLTPFDIV